MIPTNSSTIITGTPGFLKSPTSMLKTSNLRGFPLVERGFLNLEIFIFATFWKIHTMMKMRRRADVLSKSFGAG
jgi:hypothetical protein